MSNALTSSGGGGYDTRRVRLGFPRQIFSSHSSDRPPNRPASLFLRRSPVSPSRAFGSRGGRLGGEPSSAIVAAIFPAAQHEVHCTFISMSPTEILLGAGN